MTYFSWSMTHDKHELFEQVLFVYFLFSYKWERWGNLFFPWRPWQPIQAGIFRKYVDYVTCYQVKAFANSMLPLQKGSRRKQPQLHRVVKSVFLDRKVHPIKLRAGRDLLGSCELFFLISCFSSWIVFSFSWHSCGFTPKEATNFSLLDESNAQKLTSNLYARLLKKNFLFFLQQISDRRTLERFYVHSCMSNLKFLHEIHEFFQVN